MLQKKAAVASLRGDRRDRTARLASVALLVEGILLLEKGAPARVVHRQFLELGRLMPRISTKVLTEQLRELIADEIVDQQRTGPVPSPVMYSLTDYGRSVLPIAESVRLWGRRHLERFSP